MIKTLLIAATALGLSFCADKGATDTNKKAGSDCKPTPCDCHKKDTKGPDKKKKDEVAGGEGADAEAGGEGADAEAGGEGVKKKKDEAGGEGVKKKKDEGTGGEEAGGAGGAEGDEAAEAAEADETADGATE